MMPHRRVLMADFSDCLSDKHMDFIRAQKLFFVATAPDEGEGFPNLSPKGYDALHLLGPRRLAYVDLPGSGNQTAAHLAQGAGVTLMFCGFEKQAWILRIYGHGRACLAGTPEYKALAGKIESPILGDATRQIFDINIDKVQTSCGYGVPLYDYVSDRRTLVQYFEKAKAKGELDAMVAHFSRPQDNV